MNLIKICGKQKCKLDDYLIPNTKINSKWIRELSERPETIKFLEENTGSNLLNINSRNVF